MEEDQWERLIHCFGFSNISVIRLKVSTLGYFRLMSSAGRIQIRCYFQPL